MKQHQPPREGPEGEQNMSTETQHTESGNSPPDGATVAELESREPATEVEAPEFNIEAPRPRHRLTPPPPAECVSILRDKYPKALVCVTCGTMLASEAKGYAKSNLGPAGERVPLTEEQRLTYVCSECRGEAAEAARIKALRADNLRRNLGLIPKRVTRLPGARRRATRVPVGGPQSSPDISGRSRTVLRNGRAHRSGRPRVSATEQRQKARDRMRAYRQRQRTFVEVAS